jgi:hypothetical protein
MKVMVRGWLNYYGIADMKKNIEYLMAGCIIGFACASGNSGNCRERQKRNFIRSRGT